MCASIHANDIRLLGHSICAMFCIHTETHKTLTPYVRKDELVYPQNDVTVVDHDAIQGKLCANNDHLKSSLLLMQTNIMKHHFFIMCKEEALDYIGVHHDQSERDK